MGGRLGRGKRVKKKGARNRRPIGAPPVGPRVPPPKRAAECGCGWRRRHRRTERTGGFGSERDLSTAIPPPPRLVQRRFRRRALRQVRKSARVRWSRAGAGAPVQSTFFYPLQGTPSPLRGRGWDLFCWYVASLKSKKRFSLQGSRLCSRPLRTAPEQPRPPLHPPLAGRTKLLCPACLGIITVVWQLALF
jgi:hypothetical protein